MINNIYNHATSFMYKYIYTIIIFSLGIVVNILLSKEQLSSKLSRIAELIFTVLCIIILAFIFTYLGIFVCKLIN